MEQREHYRHFVQVLEKELRVLGGRLENMRGKVAHTSKQNTYDLLTEFDVHIEKEITAILRRLDPSIPVVGEESGGDRTAKKYWIVDPIDGTIHFVRGMPFCTTTLALVEHNHPTVAIIYSFVTQEFFYAIKGAGAYLNGEPISVSQRGLDSSLLLVEMTYKHPANVSIYYDLRKQFKLMDLVCAGYEFALVARGQVEARFILDPYGNDYDFAPGALLVQEAGGVVKNLDGEDYSIGDRDFIAACSPELYDSLRTTIVTHRK